MGELTDHRIITVPAIAALGGMVVPAAIYLAVNPSGEAAGAWGVVIASDTAFLLGGLSLIGATRSTPLRVFLLTLTIFDDVVAVSVIALFYTEGADVAALALAAACLAAVVALGRLRVWRGAPYVGAGLGLWLAMVESGVHPTIGAWPWGSRSPPIHRSARRSSAPPNWPAPSGSRQWRTRGRATWPCRCSRSPTRASTCAAGSWPTPSPRRSPGA
jgi:Na+/H+ antiporter NhaA